MFRIKLSHPRPMLTIVLPDTVHTLGSHRVYIRGIYLVKTSMFETLLVEINVGTAILDFCS